jgi:endonuclease-3
MVDNRSEEILNMPRRAYTLPKLTKCTDPFETLIATIISQNTTKKNAAKAFKSLCSGFKIDPETLTNSNIRKVEECLRVEGLFRQKTRAIKEASEALVQKWEGKMASILSLPIENSRKELMQHGGVGPKTADVVLLFSAQRRVIPIDAYVKRVSKRLGLAPENGNYEVVQKNLESLFRPEDYLADHLLFILHGRKTCKAQAPLCVKCPVNRCCPSMHLWDRID